MSVLSVSAGLFPSDDKTILAVKILPFATEVRNPYHLALLLDTSGSMEGVRLEAVRRTLHLLVDTMKNDDILTMVQYNSHATVIVQSHTMDSDRAMLHIHIDNLRADGGTNLEAGLLCLEPIVHSVHSVFLLTDGHINEGMSHSSGLMKLLYRSLPAGTPVHTLGYGSDHNIHLLRDMSVRSRGSYTYADAAELIPAIVGDIVGGLESMVGQNGILSIPDGWRCLELGVHPEDKVYNVGSLIAEKEQWVVMEGPPMDTVLPPIRLQWKTGEHTQSAMCTMDASIDSLQICEQRDRAYVVNVLGEVTEMLEQGDIPKARATLVVLQQELERSLAKNTNLAIRLQSQVQEMVEALRTVSYGNGVVPRMVSNSVALGTQRGMVSRIQSAPEDPHMRDFVYTFSSPGQRTATQQMTEQFSQEPTAYTVQSRESS